MFRWRWSSPPPARHVTVEDLLSSLEGTFLLLSDPHESHPARHRTLSTSLQWSHDALTSGAQELLWSLAIFVGPFTADAAADVWVADAELVDRLGELVDASLVEFDAGGNYRLLEPVRQFILATATERGVVGRLRELHLMRCLRLADTWAAERAITSFDVVDHIVRERANWSLRSSGRASRVGGRRSSSSPRWPRPLSPSDWWLTPRHGRRYCLPHSTDQTVGPGHGAVAACARLRTELGDVEFLDRAVPEAAEVARASGDAATEAACEMMLGAADFVAGRPGWSVRLAAAADLAASTGRPPLELELRSWLAWSLASNGQAADAEIQLLRCAELGAAESIHGQQCAVAAQLVSIWRGRPVDEGCSVPSDCPSMTGSSGSPLPFAVSTPVTHRSSTSNGMTTRTVSGRRCAV